MKYVQRNEKEKKGELVSLLVEEDCGLEADFEPGGDNIRPGVSIPALRGDEGLVLELEK